MKALATCLLACLALAACSGTEIIPDDVDTNRLKRVIRSGLSSLPAAATAP
jgi:hypothetical protein